MAPAEAAAARPENRTENDEKQRKNSSGMMTNSKGKAVCVMDASGSLGSALVDSLLERGYLVHAAYQSHSHSLEKQQKSERNKNLKIFDADVLDYHSILDTLNGCSALFYTFEPPLEHPIYDEQMAEIEVRAAHNVLEACAQTPTMEKVIFTSSATAVVWADTRNASCSSDDVDERSWSDVNFCKKFKLWHALSKTLAEKTAWALAMDRGVNMVSINGGLMIDNKENVHSATANKKHNIPPYLKGAAEMYEHGLLVAVDLHFLVDAHICVFEEVASFGRYLCFNHVINCHQDAVKLAAMFMSSPPQSSEEDTRVFPQRVSNKKFNKLMANFDGKFLLHV